MNPFYSIFMRIFKNNQAAEIIYQSASGELSHRVIYINKVTPQFVQGYCTLRKTTRTFSMQNILSIYPHQVNRITSSKVNYH